MRNISILIIISLFTISCSHQKQENTQQKKSSVDLPNNVPSQKDVAISMSISDHLKKNFYAIKCDTLILASTLINKKNIKHAKETVLSGYSDTFIEQIDIELYFDKKRAKEINIEPGWYICDYIAVCLNLSIPSNTKNILLPSERCGFKPGGSGSRGYAIALSNETLTLYTYVYHIKSNDSKVIDVLYPRLENKGRLFDLKWKIRHI